MNLQRLLLNKKSIAVVGVVVVIGLVVGDKLHQKRAVIRIAEQLLSSSPSASDPDFSSSSRFVHAKVSYGPLNRVTVSGVVDDPLRQYRTGAEVEMDYFDGKWHLRDIRRHSVSERLWDRIKNYVTSFLP